MTSLTHSRRALAIACTALALLTFIALPASTSAQKPEKYVDPLEKEMDELFDKLRREGDPSIPKNRRNLHEMSPQEYERFQRKFLERFFDDEPSGGPDMLPDEESVASALQRAAQEIRNRKIGTYERQNQNQLQTYRPAVEKARLSIVAVMIDGKQVAMGTVADSRGAILTKLSELGEAEKASCVFANGQRFDARLAARSKEHDLAMLHVPAVTTVPIEWAEGDSELGATVVTANQTGMPVAIGAVSVRTRSLVGTNLAFLGVGPGPHPSGVEVLQVTSDTAASRAGLREGDVIVSLDDVKMTSSISSLVNAIRAHSPGTRVEIAFLRNGQRQTTRAELDSASMPGDRELRIRLMNRMGAVPSRRHDEFPAVLQHDSPLLPEQCGGPLVNLDGKAVGINIARGGRVDSYAIPARKVKQLLSELKASQN